MGPKHGLIRPLRLIVPHSGRGGRVGRGWGARALLPVGKFIRAGSQIPSPGPHPTGQSILLPGGSGYQPEGGIQPKEGQTSLPSGTRGNQPITKEYHHQRRAAAPARHLWSRLVTQVMVARTRDVDIFGGCSILKTGPRGWEYWQLEAGEGRGWVIEVTKRRPSSSCWLTRCVGDGLLPWAGGQPRLWLGLSPGLPCPPLGLLPAPY